MVWTSIHIFLQVLWKLKLDWDTPILSEYRHIWGQWASNICSLSDAPIQTHFTSNRQATTTDASDKGYSGVHYLHHLHKDTSVSVILLTVKARAALVKPQTTPKFELWGAREGTRLLLKTLVLDKISSMDGLIELNCARMDTRTQ